MKIPSNSNLTTQCKDLSRHKITGSFGFKNFEGTGDESAFWNAASEDERSALKKRHVETGICLLCMIDEVLSQKKPEPKKQSVVEPEEQTHEDATIPLTRKIAGGLISKTIDRADASSQNVKVSWAWHNERQGVVEWTFQNTSSQQAQVILYRNSHYFGNAYWPIFENNPGFGVSFATKLEPLTDKSLQNNSAPLCIVSWKQPDGTNKNIVAFVFTLAAGQTWQMLEGGFSRVMSPKDVAVYEVSFDCVTDFKIAYDQKQVDSWHLETGASEQGYAPNPNVFSIVRVLAPPEAPYVQLFDDPIQQGGTSSQDVAKQEEAPTTPPAPASSAPEGESRVWALLAKHSGSLEQ